MSDVIIMTTNTVKAIVVEIMDVEAIFVEIN